MSRSALIGTIAILASAVLPLASSTASAQSPQKAYSSGITVYGPQARWIGRSIIGAPVMEMTARSIVYYNDLDLRTAAGRRFLEARVAAAANDACRTLNRAFPPGPAETPSPAQCPGDAIMSAGHQVHTAIEKAEYEK